VARPRGRARGRRPQKQGAANGDAVLPVWEMDLLLIAKLLPNAPPEVQRLAFVTVAERGSGLVVGAALTKPEEASDRIEQTIRDSMESPMAGPPRKPSRILVRRPELQLALTLFLRRQGIRVERAARLWVIDEVAAGLASELIGKHVFDPDDDPVVTRMRRIAGLARGEAAPNVLRRLAWSMFRAPGPQHVGDDDDEIDFAMARLMEWALFVLPVGSGNVTFAERAVDRLHQTEPDTHAELAAHLPARYTLLQMSDQESDGSTAARDLWNEEDILLAPPNEGTPAAPGTILIGTIFPSPDGRWRLGSALLNMRAEALEICPHPTEHETGADMPPRVERDVAGAGTEWIREVRSSEDLRRAYEAFREALANTGTRLPPFDELVRWVREATRRSQVYHRLEGINWWRIQEVEVFTAIVEQIWTTLREAKHGRGRSGARGPAAGSVERRALRDARAAALQLIEEVEHRWITAPVRLAAARYVRAAAKSYPDRFVGPMSESWASGAVHAAFLLLGRPRLTASALGDLFGVSTATVNSRSLNLRHMAPHVGKRDRMELFRHRLQHASEAGRG
jgi:hypothetical protein